jgi:hypothetical protein
MHINWRYLLDIRLRLEHPGDHRTVEELTREAFWGMNHPDCDEHLLAHIDVGFL